MRRIFALLTAVMFIFVFSVSSFASNGEYLIDDADLLSYSEEIMLSDEIEEICLNHNISVVIHTTDYTYGKDIATYADDFYDNGGYLEDGLIFVISMAERDYYTSTAGYLVDSLTAYDLEIICKDVVSCLSNGDYYKAFSQYLSQLNLFLNGELDSVDDFVFAGDYYGESEETVDLNDYYEDDFASSSVTDIIMHEFILFLIAIVIAVVITMILKSKMNTAVKKHDADDYVVQGSFNLNIQRDAFIGSAVTKRPLPKNNNNHHGSRPGGGGGIRVSSGGVRHGGGGGKF